MTTVAVAKNEHAQETSDNRIMDLTPTKLFWLFVVGSFIGLVVEVIYHVAVYGEYESRAGLVWGPFSPIYGTGAVVLTVLLNRLGKAPIVSIFLVAMVSGSMVEYVTSWGLETFFGAVAWDYSGTFGSIHGRVNFMFGVMWGTLGVMWVKLFIPAFDRMTSWIDWESALPKMLTFIFVAFMVVNIVFTLQAFARESARASGLQPANAIDQFYDAQFPTEWMNERFHMSIGGFDKA